MDIFEGMKKDIQKRISNTIDILPILSEDDSIIDGHSIQSYGQKDLIQKSIEKFKNAINHVDFSTIKSRIIQLIREEKQEITKSFESIQKELNSFQCFDESKNYLKKTLKDLLSKITGENINELSVKSSVDNWSRCCKFEV